MKSPLAPDVTVILPVYNGERHLAAALDSIVTQSLAPFEIIAVDDGSSDNSGRILEDYARRHDGLVVQHNQTNSGITFSLNLACQMARGRYLAIANQDDICMPDRLAKQVAFLESRPDIDLIGSAASIIGDDGRAIRIKTYPTEPSLAAWSMFFFSSILHPAAMFRHETLRAMGFYPKGYGGGTEDYAVGVRMAQVGRLASLPDVLLEYRLHESNVTKTKWHEQEAEANRIAAEGMEHWLGEKIPLSMAANLRGLSTEQYPADPAAMREVGKLVRRLHHAFQHKSGFNRAELRAVDRDASLRLWLLATLAITRSPRIASGLASSAMAIDSFSIPAFASKVAKVAGGRLSAKLRSRTTNKVG